MKTQQIMMDEILLSVTMLAEDQYGNYVVQVGAHNYYFILSLYIHLLIRSISVRIYFVLVSDHTVGT